MNRLLPTIIILLIFCANAASGLSGGCCCPTDTLDLIKCSDEGCRSHDDSSCNHKSAASRDCSDKCMSFQCPQDLNPAMLSESVLPQHQAPALHMDVIDARAYMKTVWFDPRLLLSRLENPVPLLLQTCSFLS